MKNRQLLPYCIWVVIHDFLEVPNEVTLMWKPSQGSEWFMTIQFNKLFMGLLYFVVDINNYFYL